MLSKTSTRTTVGRRSRSGTKYSCGRAAPPEPAKTTPAPPASAPTPAAPPVSVPPAAPAPAGPPADTPAPAPAPPAAPTPAAPPAPAPRAPAGPAAPVPPVRAPPGPAAPAPPVEVEPPVPAPGAPPAPVPPVAAEPPAESAPPAPAARLQRRANHLRSSCGEGSSRQDNAPEGPQEGSQKVGGKLSSSVGVQTQNRKVRAETLSELETSSADPVDQHLSDLTLAAQGEDKTLGRQHASRRRSASAKAGEVLFYPNDSRRNRTSTYSEHAGTRYADEG
ncbi:unnamed protein product [Closterium sp. NIES-53]